MRTLILVSSVLAVTASVASAEPSIVASVPAPSTAYLGGGVALGAAYNGGASGVAYGAFELEGGIRLGDPRLWAHVLLAQGGMADVDGGGGSNDYLDARVGLESPVCSARRFACLVVGVDLGVRHERLMDDSDNLRTTNAEIVPRLGLDIGTAHFRVRPTAEVAFDSNGDYAVALSLASAYRW